MKILLAQVGFQRKRKADGTVDRFKARIMAQGYSQQYGVDYSEVFARVTRANCITEILSVANAMIWNSVKLM